jgi:hypothetical protein
MADETRDQPVQRITADDKVGAVVDRYPAAIAVLERHGFTQITNPVMRRTVARFVSIGDAASMRGVDLEKLLADLNAVVGG